MRKRYIQILLLAPLLFYSEQGFSALPEKFVDVDNDLIIEVCGSTFKYALDKPFNLNRVFNEQEYRDRKANLESNIERSKANSNDSAIYEEQLRVLEENKEPYFQDEFQEMANCYLNKSMKNVVDETNDMVQEQHEEYKNAGDYPVQIDTTTECEADLPPPNFESTCAEDLPEYSPCKVAERLLAEHCAYSMWLWAKQYHSESLIFPIDKYHNVADVNTLRDIRLNEYNTERYKTEKAIFRTIEVYEQNAKSFGTYAYLESVRENLLYFNQKFTRFRQAFESFPEKFINAMAKFCKQ